MSGRQFHFSGARLSVLPLAVAVAALAACPPPATVVDGVPAPPDDGIVFTEANAAALFSASMDMGTARAELARERTRGEVHDYVDRAHTTYRDLGRRSTELFAARGITPTREAHVRRALDQHEQSMAVLRQWEEGPGFDRTYLTNEIANLRWTIQALDDMITPVTRDRAMREFVMEARTPLMELLREAERLEGRVGG